MFYTQLYSYFRHVPVFRGLKEAGFVPNTKAFWKRNENNFSWFSFICTPLCE